LASNPTLSAKFCSARTVIPAHTFAPFLGCARDFRLNGATGLS
jgi:hypothetical protein